MNTLPAQEVKRRGVAAFDELVGDGPIHIIRRNRPEYVVVYAPVWTAAFMRAADTITRRNPALKRKLADVLRNLEKDPWQPRLRAHRLHGELSGAYAVRVTESHRIIATTAVTENEIVLLDMGTHGEVYR
jgi:mRNA-degrading endonuclease YafQ of YafQ-DinJ toxin-antitoxin module